MNFLLLRKQLLKNTFFLNLNYWPSCLINTWLGVLRIVIWDRFLFYFFFFKSCSTVALQNWFDVVSLTSTSHNNLRYVPVRSWAQLLFNDFDISNIHFTCFHNRGTHWYRQALTSSSASRSRATKTLILMMV